MKPARYAGFWIRVAAAIVDSIILLFVNGGIVLLLTGDHYPSMFESALHGSMPSIVVEGALVYLLPLANLLQLVVSWLYMAWFESSRHQATPGKMLLKLKVVDQRDQRISFGRATGRSFAKYLSTMICLIGWIMVAFTERKQGLHDILAGTFVVPDRPVPPPK